MEPSAWSVLPCTVYSLTSELINILLKTFASGVLLLSLLELNLHKGHLHFTVCNTTLVNVLHLSNLIMALLFSSLFLLMETPFFLVFSDDWSNLVMSNATFLSEKVWQSNTGYGRDCQWLHYFKVHCLSTSSLPPPTFGCVQGNFSFWKSIADQDRIWDRLLMITLF